MIKRILLLSNRFLLKEKWIDGTGDNSVNNLFSRFKMSKCSLAIGFLFILMAIVEINAQDFNPDDFKEQFNKQLGDLLGNAEEEIKKLGISEALGNEEITEVLNKAGIDLGRNSSAQLNFSFVTIIMSLFYAYIIA